MQKFFLVLSFFLIQSSIFSQSDDIEGKLKAQEEAMKDKSNVEEKDTLNTDYYKIFYLDGRIDTVDTTLSIYKDYKFRLQLFCHFLINILAILPWFYNNWIMILSGTYRAVFESATIEGDPSIFGFESIFWYFPYLINQFGSIIFLVGLSGLIFTFLSYIRSLKKHIVAIGGGGFDLNNSNYLIEKYILNLSQKKRPKI